MSGEDHELVSRFHNGDIAAFDELYHRYKDRLYTYVRGIVSEAAAEDVIQEVFSRFFSRARRLRRPGSIKPFLFACAHNSAVDQLRRRASAPLPDDDTLTEPLDARHDGLSTVRLCLARLRIELREIVFLKAYEEMTLEEISDVLQRPMGTVAAQYRAALEKLRAYLEPVREELA